MRPQRTLSRGDVAWSYFSQAAQYGSGLIALPFLLRYLSPESFGLWSAFLLVSSVVQLLDFGLQPALIRHVAYCTAGRRVEKSDIALLAYVRAARSIYRWLVLVLLLVQVGVGSAYLNFIAPSITNRELAAWLIFALGSSASFYAAHYGAILQGIHRVGVAQKINSVSRVANLAVTIIFLVLGYGLLACAAGAALGGLIAMKLYRGCLRETIVASAAAPIVTHQAEVKAARSALTKTAKSLGSVSVAGFLILRSTSLAASLFLALNEFAAFSLATQVFQALVSLARVRFTASVALMSEAAHQKDLTRFLKIYRTGTRHSWLLFALGSMMVVGFGPTVVAVINEKAISLGRISLFCMAGLYFLEVIHGNASIALTCFNKVPFVVAAWVTGIAISAGSFTLGLLVPNNPLALVLVQLLVQLSYNAWRWPLELRRICQTPSTNESEPSNNLNRDSRLRED